MCRRGKGAYALSLQASWGDFQLCRQGGLCSLLFVCSFLVCLFLPPLASQDLRAVLEELTQESDFAPTGLILTHLKPSPKQAVPKLESLQRNPGRARQGLRTFPMEADRTLSLLSLSGRRSRGGLITVTRTLVRKYPGRNNKPGT